jgi:lysophospholipase L1-like esterase
MSYTACRPHAEIEPRPNASVAGANSPVATRYYLSLGNSLATSNLRMPGRGSRDAEGYTDQLYQIARSRNPSLEHVPLACPGETAHGMIYGGSCDPRLYPFAAGTQLADAAHFLETHRGNVAFVTIDVGGNDLAACANWKPDVHREELGPDFRACFGPILQDLRRIVTDLRAAGGPDTRIVGMNYYSAMLASWLSGQDGKVVATQLTDSLVVPFNAALEAVFARAGVPTVDVAAAFSTTDYTLVGDPQRGHVPRNVLRICQWTRMCDARDVHPNTEGYRVIARAFAAVLGL